MNRNRINKKRINVILVLLMLITQWTYGFGSMNIADAAEIQDNIITSVTMAVYDDSGNTVTSDVYEQTATVKLNYNWSLPNGAYHKGDTYTYTFNLPDKFVLASNIEDKPLIFEGETLGLFDVIQGSPNKVVMTFNDNITEYFDVHGSLSINTRFDKQKLEETIVQDIVFPINGGNQTFTVQFKPDVSSTIEKKGEPISLNKNGFNANQINWTVDVNKDLDTVSHAMMSDSIPSGLILNDPLDVKVYNLNIKLDGTSTVGSAVPGSEYGVSVENGVLKVLFTHSPITGAYRIAYSTLITDEQKKDFNNTAIFDGDEVNPVNASADVQVDRGEFLHKTSPGSDSAAGVTHWEIQYNYNESSVLQADGVLTDYFDDTQDLVLSSIKVYPVNFLNDVNGTTGPELSPSQYSVNTSPIAVVGKKGFTLSFNNNISGAYKIQYDTKATGRIEDNLTIKNTVTSATYTAGATGVIEQTILRKTLGNINYTDKTAQWSIQINGDSFDMNDVILKDSFTRKGLKLIPGSLAVKAGSRTLAAGTDYIFSEVEGEGFNIQFSDPLAEPHTITYTTTFNNDWLEPGWLDQESQFINKADLEWKYPSSSAVETKSQSAALNPRKEVKDNGFKYGSYNAVQKEITWTIGINYNGKTITTPLLTDVLQKNQSYISDSVEIYPMTVESDGTPKKGAVPISADKYNIVYTAQTKQLEIGFKDPIHAPYYVIFKTSLKGQLIDSSIPNIVNLRDGSNAVSRDLTANLSIPRADEYVSKTGVQDNSKIKWTLMINRNQSFVKNAKITDDPSANQMLLPDSFHLYPTTVISDGTVTKALPELVKGTDYELLLTTNEDTGLQQFVLSFKYDIEKPYILEYDSLIVANNGDTINNQVKFEGNNSTTVSKTNQKSVIVALSDADGVGTGFKKQLTVTKVDDADHNTLLSGAIFALYRLNGSEEVLFNTITTNAQGTAVFKNLWPGKYVIQEKEAPQGYILDTRKRTVTFNSTTETILMITNLKDVVPPVEPVVTPVTSSSPSPIVSEVPADIPVVPTPMATPSPLPVMPTPMPSGVPGVVVPSPNPSPLATATPKAEPTNPSPTPIATKGTTLRDVPIEGEIPLGGVPSIGDHPDHGEVIFTGDGKWVYTPDPGYIGKDKFTIIVTDQDGKEEEIVIEINVDEVPKGTVPEPLENGDHPATLPKTGEDSPLMIYIMGASMIILGLILTRRWKRPNKAE